MAIKQITPQEAYDMLNSGEGCVYIDVRTEHEFSSGHPEGAVNIPIAFPDPAQGMALNKEFAQVVEANFLKDKKIILGCQAGPRSNRAAELLQGTGYQDISSVRGGFGGMRDPSGQVIAPGWSSLGLPVSQENADGVSYESLAAKAN
ncbi:MAG: rhodanese-like domain-containing protein [Deltaproteobacteria bacterium]|nr:rhodanese-like domain-containing protein [Deltaproteobacteria bacterium]